MTRAQPTPADQRNIERGWPVVKRVVTLHIGQSIAVAAGRIIAVEAMEGTDLMIERAARLHGGAGWTLLKAPSHDHDMRFDVPTVGPVTIERLKKSGARCLAVEAGRVIMIDKPALLEAADDAGIAVIGVPSSP